MESAEYTGNQQVYESRAQVASQMSIGSWIVTFILLVIPLVSIIMLFIWAFDATSQRRNFARAYLIIAGIMIALWIVAIIIIIALGASSGFFDIFTQ